MISVDYNYTDLHIECFLTCLNYLDDMKDSIHIVQGDNTLSYMIMLDLMEPKWWTSTCTWKQKQFKISTGLWSGSSLDFNPIKDARDILQQKISACNSPKIYQSFRLPCRWNGNRSFKQALRANGQQGKQGWYCLTEFILNASNHFDDMKLLFIRIFASGLLQTKGFAE